MDVFSFAAGRTPLLVSIPHDGRELAPGQAARMSGAGRGLPDTDWHVRRLYNFVEDLGATIIAANYSRYVVDLNRSADDAALYNGQVSTGLCPELTFAGEPIYEPGLAITGAERESRVDAYWRPYHDRLQLALDEIREQHGYVVLWDAHTIASNVPRLFDGELPDLNVGTALGTSCGPDIEQAVIEAARESACSSVLNGRFSGGYITRHYGRPDVGVHAVQLELTQQNYMDEATGRFDQDKAATLRPVIQAMLAAALEALKNR